MMSSVFLVLLALVSLIHHIDAPEDLVPLNRGADVVASSLKGGLYYIDTKTRRVSKIGVSAIPEASHLAYPCSSLRTSGAFVTHGLSLKRNADGEDRLFVVRHGGREAVEIFRLDRRDDIRSLEWLGCVRFPKGFSGNAVVGRTNGGFYATAMTDMGDASVRAKLATLYSGKPSGAVIEWTPSSGYRTFLSDRIAAPNGIELSPDQRDLYVAAWAERRIWRFDANNAQVRPQSVTVPFLPDNLRWSANGERLLSAGVQSAPAATFSCAMSATPEQRCVTHWAVATIDPRKMSVVSNIAETAGFADVSTAVEIRNTLWLGSFGGTTIGIWNE